jgi:sec-independent protein translocase protein TatA
MTMMEITPLFVPIPGGMELVIILAIAILLFGANKLPKLARSSGQAIGEFKRGREELEDELRATVEDGQNDVPSDPKTTEPSTK